jgi:molybdate transport system ATP-binding protein
MIHIACALSRPGFSLDTSFEAGAGVTALFGPSGSGKTTIFRILAGLERVERGFISLNGRVLLDTDKGINIPPHRRRIGLVFQDSKLFPHLNVRQNLTYGRWFGHRWPGEGAAKHIPLGAVLDMLGIAPLLNRRVEGLSGGEKQRVALGRAILAGPDMLAMDEPLASLDAARKAEILPFILRLRDECAIPILYISHSREEVMALANHVVMVEAGRITATGLPADMLHAQGAAGM